MNCRQRFSFNDGWRFAKGDPADVDPETLLYDVRPVVEQDDERMRRAEDTAEASTIAPPTKPVLKPWILPTGNRFLKDPAKRRPRPLGPPNVDPAFARPNFDDSHWRAVTLPHDWAIEGPFTPPGTGIEEVGGGMGRLPSPGVGWYRRTFEVPSEDADRRIYLDIDGAMSYSAVWLNGKLIGGWPYGYASYRLDLTPFLRFGDINQLSIRLDNPPDFSRWYPGAGLYRNVWLTKTSAVHVGQWGTRVTTPSIGDEAATVSVDVTIDNTSTADVSISAVTEIFELDAGGQPREGAVAIVPASIETRIAAGRSVTITGTTTVTSPKRWGPPPTQRPFRYLAVTHVLHEGAEIDRYETTFGIRELAFKGDGIYVNGERIRLQGVNHHHDLGALGAAYNDRAAERQLEMLREAGCNAIRMAHNPPAPELLDLADRMGFLVIDEIFDAWVRRKTPFDFHLIFPEWHEQDLRAFMARDRNHPSVFLWSVGNEVGEQYTGEEGAGVLRRLLEIAAEEDSTRPATASMNWAKPDSAFAALTDVISLNYQGEGIRDTPEFDGFSGIRTPPLYGKFREAFPGRTILSSESAAAFSSRGVHLFPIVPGVTSPVRDGLGGDSSTRQVSGYELYAADFGSSADKVFGAQDRHPFVAGEFVWIGWDYLGEPSPYYDARSSYFGMIDLAGFPKDRYCLYQIALAPRIADGAPRPALDLARARWPSYARTRLHLW